MSDKEALVEQLKRVLADTYVLYLKTQNCHWNVTGPQFKSLHDLFQIQYENMAEAIDELAEQIRILGAYAPGSLSAYAELSSIQEITQPLNAADVMLTQLEADQATLQQGLEKGISLAQACEDEATTDLLIGRLATHQKFAWMLRSSK